ncbi:hypothetical protein Tco_0882793 [Tanacetum coccineum]
MPTEMELTLEQTQQGVSYEVSFDESNANVLDKFYTSVGNPVKEILLKLNLPDHRSTFTDSKMVVKEEAPSRDGLELGSGSGGWLELWKEARGTRANIITAGRPRVAH